MRGVFILLVIPFVIKAQQPTDNKTNEIRNTQIENETTKNNARKLIESYRQRVIKGEAMSVIAALYSEDPGSATKGGRYDNVPRGVMAAEFEAVAFSLKSGQISEVFETKYGFHFIELIERKGEFVDLRHLLIIPK